MSQVEVPLPVFASRHTPNLDQFRGDRIRWQRGDPAWYTSSETGERRACVIDSSLVGHDSHPGEYFYECSFPDEDGQRYAVLAKALSIREGWKP